MRILLICIFVVLLQGCATGELPLSPFSVEMKDGGLFFKDGEQVPFTGRYTKESNGFILQTDYLDGREHGVCRKISKASGQLVSRYIFVDGFMLHWQCYDNGNLKVEHLNIANNDLARTEGLMYTMFWHPNGELAEVLIRKDYGAGTVKVIKAWLWDEKGTVVPCDGTQQNRTDE